MTTTRKPGTPDRKAQRRAAQRRAAKPAVPAPRGDAPKKDAPVKAASAKAAPAKAAPAKTSAAKTTPAKTSTAKTSAAKKGTARPVPSRAPGRPASRTRPQAKPAAKPAAPAGKKAKPAPKAARAAAAGQPPRTPFVLLICGLLGGALVSLLLLNTVLAEDAISMTQLQRSTKLLEQQRQAYQSDIAREESPENLARKAEALGMKRPESLLFVDYNGRPTDSRSMRQVPQSAAAAAGAAGVVGIPGAIVPGDGVPSAPGRGTEAARP